VYTAEEPLRARRAGRGAAHEPSGMALLANCYPKQRARRRYDLGVSASWRDFERRAPSRKLVEWCCCVPTPTSRTALRSA